MNQGTKLSLSTDVNGGVNISNEETTITIQPDGTVAISTEAPLQLTGTTLAKLDMPGIGSIPTIQVCLGRRLKKH